MSSQPTQKGNTVVPMFKSVPPRTITFAETLATAREVVAERPTWIDSTHGFHGENGCLSGVVMTRLGLSVAPDAGTPKWVLRRNRRRFDFEYGVQQFLEVLMMVNDVGAMWYQALAAGEQMASEDLFLSTTPPEPDEDDGEQPQPAPAGKATIDAAESEAIYESITHGKTTFTTITMCDTVYAFTLKPNKLTYTYTSA